ncbi:MAG: hypothetical protein BWY83_00660 [bacterium ADurb.Bin478]|nr:MAG: hypothetical protein BWY83_00660 [bacterium ADurb.Bin478]
MLGQKIENQLERFYSIPLRSGTTDGHQHVRDLTDR